MSSVFSFGRCEIDEFLGQNKGGLAVAMADVTLLRFLFGVYESDADRARYYEWFVNSFADGFLLLYAPLNTLRADLIRYYLPWVEGNYANICDVMYGLAELEARTVLNDSTLTTTEQKKEALWVEVCSKTLYKFCERKALELSNYYPAKESKEILTGVLPSGLTFAGRVATHLQASIRALLLGEENAHATRPVIVKLDPSLIVDARSNLTDICARIVVILLDRVIEQNGFQTLKLDFCNLLSEVGLSTRTRDKELLSEAMQIISRMFLVFPDERKRTKPIAPIPFVMIGAARSGRGIRTYIVDFGTWWKYLKPDDVQVTATPDAWRRNDRPLPRLVEVIRERATRQGSIEHPVTVRELLVSAFGPVKVDADLKRKSRRQRLLSDLNEAFEKARSQGIRWRVTGDSDSIDALIWFAAPPPPDICQIREFLQRTQTNLARDLNLSQSQVSRIETGAGYDLDPLQKLKLVKMLTTESPNQGQRTNVSRRLGAGS